MTRARIAARRTAVWMAAAAVLLASCEHTGDGPDAPAPAMPAPTVPAEWTGRHNPLSDDPATIARGRALYETNCSVCHGLGADGKGPSAVGLIPPPADFKDGKRLSSHSDDYLFWRISTGKSGTAMPAFGGTLSEDERWAILRMLRSLPGARPKESP